MLHKFKVVLERDEEGHAYVVSVPALPGCFTQGKTREEALDRAKEAIEGYLEALKQEGQTMPPQDVEFAEVQVEIAS